MLYFDTFYKYNARKCNILIFSHNPMVAILCNSRGEPFFLNGQRIFLFECEPHFLVNLQNRLLIKLGFVDLDQGIEFAFLSWGSLMHVNDHF